MQWQKQKLLLQNQEGQNKLPFWLDPAWYKEKITSRLPSRREVLAIYGFVVFVVYSWTVLSSLWKFPSWLFFLDPLQILSVYAYSFTFDFIESILILSSLLVVTMIVPARLWKANFVSNGVLVTAIFIISLLCHSYYYFINGSPTEFISTQKAGLAMTIVITAITIWISFKISWFRRSLEGLANRCLVFLYIYPVLTIISFCVVITRNIFRL